ncbi:integrase core domain-containing protein [Nesterenkonia flava]|uniref:integrase core domain-containing protein n=1 Tax=Nesterenkonia flava TaxID=469799 RepID=UPI003CD0978C
MKTPGQNGSRERGFGTLKYERLYLDEIDDAIVLAERAEDYRIEYNELRPHEAISWNRPKEVHLGRQVTTGNSSPVSGSTGQASTSG